MAQSHGIFPGQNKKELKYKNKIKIVPPALQFKFSAHFSIVSRKHQFRSFQYDTVLYISANNGMLHSPIMTWC